MAGTPPVNLANTLYQAGHADTFHLLPEEVEQTFQKHTLCRYMFNGTMAKIDGEPGAPRPKGVPPPPKNILVGSASRLSFEIDTGNMGTVAALDPANAISTSVDQAKPADTLRTLNGWWALIYGYSTWGIEEEALWGGNDAHIPYLKRARKQICQQLTDALSESIYSDGTTNRFDGFEYWAAVTGTKWNSADIGTAKYLQAQQLTGNISEFTYDTWMQWIDSCTLGTIATIGNSEGRRPTVCVTTKAMIRLFKKWVMDKVVYNVNPSPSNISFLEYGQPEDYVIMDGVLCFADDNGLSNILSTNAAAGYIFNPEDWRLIFHKSKKYGFKGIDAGKVGGEAPEDFLVIELPDYVQKSLFKKVILGNMFCLRPRNFGRFLLANA